MTMRQLKITRTITNRESASLDKYLLEIGRFPLISPEEESRLAELIKQGNKQALNDLVTDNLRFVVSVAKQYQYQGVSLSDLINEGNLGLLQAARLFDPTRGFRFISYAVWWIRQHIIQSLAQNGRLIRLPLNKVATIARIQKAGSILEQKLERAASVEEIAELMGIDEEEVQAGLERYKRMVSLDTPITENGDDSLLDVLENKNAENADKEINYNGSLQIEVDRSLDSLKHIEKAVICYYFGIGVDHPMSLDEIGKKIYLTRERVRQIKEKAIGKLRTIGNIGLLRNYLCA
jgi:RNA polymerase primary sigma factor